MKNYYYILGISKGASPEEIRKAFRAKAMELHPDRRQASEKEQAEADFKQLFEAYEHLMDGQGTDLGQELDEIFSSFVKKGDFDQHEWARTMFDMYRAQSRAADIQPYQDTKVTEFEVLLESPSGLYVGLWVRDDHVRLKIPTEKEQKALRTDGTVFTLDDLLSAVKEELEPEGYQQNGIWVKDRWGRPYKEVQIFNKDGLVSTRENFKGKNEVTVDTHSSLSFSVTREDGRTIYIPHESLTAQSNQFEFSTGYMDEGYPIVINQGELTIILDSLWVAAGKALGTVNYVLLHPNGWDIMPSPEQLRQRFGKEGRVMGVDGFSTYVFNHTLDDGTLETITLQDRQNSGYLMPFIYTASRRLTNPVGIMDAKQMLDEMCLVSASPKKLRTQQNYALQGGK